MRKGIVLAALAVAVMALGAGCQSFPIKVSEVGTLAPGQKIEFNVASNAVRTGYILSVQLDLSGYELPDLVKDLPIDGQAWILYGVEKPASVEMQAVKGK